MARDNTELKKRTGLDDGMIYHARNEWNQMPMKRILIAELEIEIEKHRTALETCEEKDLCKLQAAIKANRILITKINDQTQKV